MAVVRVAVLCLLFMCSPFVLCENTLAEWREIFSENFRDMDTNKDGRTTFAEYQHFFLHGQTQQTLQEYLQQIPADDANTRNILTADFRFFDFDGDDILTVSDLRHNMNIIDENSDGYIEDSEFVAYASRMYLEKKHPAFGK